MAGNLADQCRQAGRERRTGRQKKRKEITHPGKPLHLKNQAWPRGKENKKKEGRNGSREDTYNTSSGTTTN